MVALAGRGAGAALPAPARHRHRPRRAHRGVALPGRCAEPVGLGRDALLARPPAFRRGQPPPASARISALHPPRPRLPAPRRLRIPGPAGDRRRLVGGALSADVPAVPRAAHVISHGRHRCTLPGVLPQRLVLRRDGVQRRAVDGPRGRRHGPLAARLPQPRRDVRGGDRHRDRGRVPAAEPAHRLRARGDRGAAAAAALGSRARRGGDRGRARRRLVRRRRGAHGMGSLPHRGPGP